jgi:hypothetical protein
MLAIGSADAESCHPRTTSPGVNSPTRSMKSDPCKEPEVDLLFKCCGLPLRPRDRGTNDRSQRAGQQLLPSAKDQGGRDELPPIRYQTSHSRHRSGQVSRCRRAGRYRWGTRHWRSSLGVPAATSASTPGPRSDSGSLAECVPFGTVEELHRCIYSKLHSRPTGKRRTGRSPLNLALWPQTVWTRLKRVCGRTRDFDVACDGNKTS